MRTFESLEKLRTKCPHFREVWKYRGQHLSIFVNSGIEIHACFGKNVERIIVPHGHQNFFRKNNQFQQKFIFDFFVFNNSGNTPLPPCRLKVGDYFGKEVKLKSIMD